MDLGLSGAHAVVTGGSKGMGRAVAERLAAEGAQVAVLARGQGALDETVDSLHARRGPGLVRPLRRLHRPGRRSSGAFAELGGRWSTLNVLVNTLGPGAGRFEQLDDAGWDTTFSIGLMAAVRAVRGPRCRSCAPPSGPGS